MTSAKKERTRRTPDQIVADLEARIEQVRARTLAREARQLPEVKALVVGARAVDKAIAVAGEARRDELVRGFESARAGLGEQLVALGVRLPDRKARRGRREEGRGGVGPILGTHLKRDCRPLLVQERAVED